MDLDGIGKNFYRFWTLQKNGSARDRTLYLMRQLAPLALCHVTGTFFKSLCEKRYISYDFTSYENWRSSIFIKP
jgi:hypothetical protein